MGILEDLGVFDDPVFEQLRSGTVPRPGSLQDLGIDITQFQPQVQPGRGGMLESLGINRADYGLGTGMPTGMVPPEPELTWGRAGGAFVEGAKDVGRNYSEFLGAVSDSLNRMKTVLPGYETSETVRSFVDNVSMFHPVLGPLSRPEAGEALFRLAKSEYLATDPEYYQSSGWIEDVLRAGPQMGAMVLANIAGGPPAGMAAMGMMIAGGTYRNLVDQGVDKDKALAYGLVNGIVQAPLEQIPFQKLGRFFKQRRSLLNDIRNLVGVAGAEWATEFIQAFPDEFINIFATNPNKPMLDRTGMFLSKLGEIAKQGAYEGTLTAPWAILMGGGALGVRNYREAQEKRRNEELLAQLHAENDGRPRQEKPLGGMTPPLLEPLPAEPITEAEFAAQGQRYLESLEAGIPTEGITEEQFMADAIENLYNLEFDVEFERRRAESRQRFLEREDLVAKAMAAAEQRAADATFQQEFDQRREGYREFLAEQAEKQREAGIYALDNVAFFDAQREAYKENLKQREQAQKVREERARQQRETAEYKKALAQRRKELNEALAFIKAEDLAGPEAKPISREQYKKLREALGPQVSEIYEIDNDVPPEHRVTFFKMWRDAAKRTKPDWYKQPFKAGDVEGYKFTDHDLTRLMQKLYLNQTLTAKQQDMYDRLLEVSTQIQRQGRIDEMLDRQSLEALADTGYEIVAGKAMPWGAVGGGSRIIMQTPDGTWDEYTMVGIKGPNAQFANESSMFEVPAGEVTDKIIGYRIDEEWLKQRQKEVKKPPPEAKPQEPIIEVAEKFAPENRAYQAAMGAVQPLFDEEMSVQELQDYYNTTVSNMEPDAPFRRAYEDYAKVNNVALEIPEAAPEVVPEAVPEVAPEEVREVRPVEAPEVAPEKGEIDLSRGLAGVLEGPAPLEERREIAEREAWDVPFREEWLNAKDSTEPDFVEYGKRKAAAEDPEFLEFMQRMGKQIDSGTPLESAMKLVWARVRGGLTPRKRTEEKTKAELQHDDRHDYLTGLKRRQSFDLDPLKKYYVALDLDSLGWINTNLGHQTGDAALIFFGDAMRATGLDPDGLYHISGDEFWIANDDPIAIGEGLKKMQNFLDTLPFNVNYKGVTIPYRIGVSYGIGPTKSEAEIALGISEAKRRDLGERAKKKEATPPQFLAILAERGLDTVSRVTEPEKVVPERVPREAVEVPALPEEPTHEQVQGAIDSVEDQLEAAGVPASEWSEYPQLEDLYRRRSKIEADQMVEGLSLIPGDQLITVNLLHAETGDRIPRQQGADKALREVDQQLDKYYMLLECLDASS